jgi:DnaJ-class molecular chaperone
MKDFADKFAAAFKNIGRPTRVPCDYCSGSGRWKRSKCPRCCGEKFKREGM